MIKERKENKSAANEDDRGLNRSTYVFIVHAGPRVQETLLIKICNSRGIKQQLLFSSEIRAFPGDVM